VLWMYLVPQCSSAVGCRARISAAPR
jgi:hypothetical protein